MPVKASGPEMELRRELFTRGLRYRVNLRDLPGSPDVVFAKAKIAIFVDGCFWHGCDLHFHPPRNNRAWWVNKIVANRARDARITCELESSGWWVLRYWEHDDMQEAADEIQWLRSDLLGGGAQ